ncbi:arabinogalactan O-methyltransferase 1-like [Apium graveolens]|uniref:arabinogalactan O-methyltransferase 1-like n=1 Tax=Apium graveolens TaxID=4045 RepID=UPI003D79278F
MMTGLPLKIKNISRKSSNVVLEKHLFLAIIIVLIITGSLTIISFSSRATSALCTYVTGGNISSHSGTFNSQVDALLHYATSRDIAQQSHDEIYLSLNVLRSLAPCNFLVFGLGLDSLMWAAFNPRGITLFLEEDIKWVHKVLTRTPLLRVHAIDYNTRLTDADGLLQSYKSVKECLPPRVSLRGNVHCRLALSELPDEFYNREWDVIMIDGPKGYFPAAPGRMSVIFSVAVMARGRTRPGLTHVFLHDVNRKVEKQFAEEFLCKKYLVKAVDRLWHFAIPPAKYEDGTSKITFC